MKIGPFRPVDPVQQEGQAKSGGSSTGQAAMAEVAPGTSLRGKVVSLDGSGRYLVETAAGSFRAKSVVPLEIGKNFWFEMAVGGAKPLLAAATLKNGVTDLLRQLFPGMAALAGLPDELAKLGAAAPDARQLAQLLVDSAVGPEPDLAKLLRLLLLVKGKGGGETPRVGAGAPAGSDPEAVSQQARHPALHKLAELLDSHQALNRPPAPTAGSIPNDFYLFPCFFAGRAGFGEWLFSFEQKQEGSAESDHPPAQRLSFYLAMSELGDLHLDLALRDKTIEGTFSLASPEAASYLAASLPALQTSLRQFCETVSFTCTHHSQLRTLLKIKSDLSARAGLSDFVLLDVTA